MNSKRALRILGWLVVASAGLSLGGCSVAGKQETGPLKIALIGDSTMANYPANVPDRGWGQFVQEYFDKDVTVLNLARNGRSTKTFINEGLWQKALDERPNYVLIQFGHNDSHAPQNPESTNSATDFREYLHQYIDQSRQIDATPILITPVQRRTYGVDGKLDNSLLPYADAMKAVAREEKVGIIDLNASSGRLYERLGDQANPAVSRNGTDRTHFNERGARWMAELVMQELVKVEPTLKGRVTREIPREVDVTIR